MQKDGEYFSACDALFKEFPVTKHVATHQCRTHYHVKKLVQLYLSRGISASVPGGGEASIHA